MSTLLLEEMTWPEIKTALKSGFKTVIIPSGSIEQHGLHLAQLADTAIAKASAVDLAKRLGKTLVAPVIRPGLSDHHLALPGTISLRPEVFSGLIEDYINSYIKHGFKQFVLISAHGGNFSALDEIALKFSQIYPDRKFVTGFSLTDLLDLINNMETDENMPEGACGGHACDYETSVLLYLSPQHVRMDQAKPGYVGKPTRDVLDQIFKGDITAISKTGVLGNPSNAKAERGKRYFEKEQEALFKTVKEKLYEY